jgi:predicted enzyme involved in methoxymalonyl-ACP biosynthesis
MSNDIHILGKEIVPMKRIESLRKQRENLETEIVANLDLLAGSIAKSPSMTGYTLTTKRNGKTVTVYVRKEILSTVQAMTKRHKKVKALLLDLSRVNWEILRMENE